MKIKASLLRNIVQASPIPVPRRILEPLLDSNIVEIDDNNKSKIVRAKWGNNRLFKIKNPREYLQKGLYFYSYYEIRETFFINKILLPRDRFIDIGANIGYFTIIAADKVGDHGKVISFEPSSKIFEHLIENIELNSFTSIIQPEKLAVSDSHSTETLQGTLDFNEGTGSIFKLPDISGCSVKTQKPPEKVKTVKFDDYYQKCDCEPIKLMKIDVEGAELNVIRGMRQTLKARLCKYILIEVSDFRLRQLGHSRQELLDILEDYDYRLYNIKRFGDIEPLTNVSSEGNIVAKLEN